MDADYSVPPSDYVLLNGNFNYQFKVKENKYYANLVNNSPSAFGEIVWGSSSSGLKGFYGEVTMKVNNSNDLGSKELFAASTGFVKSY